LTYGRLRLEPRRGNARRRRAVGVCFGTRTPAWPYCCPACSLTLLPHVIKKVEWQTVAHGWKRSWLVATSSSVSWAVAAWPRSTWPTTFGTTARSPLKVLHPELAATLGPERFQREIRIAARLQHPHILAVHDSGEAGGQLWYTMPFVEGESLRDRLRREGQLPLRTRWPSHGKWWMPPRSPGTVSLRDRRSASTTQCLMAGRPHLSAGSRNTASRRLNLDVQSPPAPVT